MGKFIFNEKTISGVYEVKPQLFGDNRGYFMETYTQRDFDTLGFSYDWVQDNQSSSRKGSFARAMLIRNKRINE